MHSDKLLWSIGVTENTLNLVAFTASMECVFRTPVSSHPAIVPFILQAVTELNEAGSRQEQETIAAGLTYRLLSALLLGQSQLTSSPNIIIFESSELFEDIPNQQDWK